MDCLLKIQRSSIKRLKSNIAYYLGFNIIHLIGRYTYMSFKLHLLRSIGFTGDF